MLDPRAGPSQDARLGGVHMRQVLVLVVVSAVAVLSSSCLPRRIGVSASPEGNTCIRECMQVETQCLAGNGGAYACRVRENECRKTCPGAIGQ